MTYGHCEEHSDKAIQKCIKACDGLDCFACHCEEPGDEAIAMTGDDSQSSTCRHCEERSVPKGTYEAIQRQVVVICFAAIRKAMYIFSLTNETAPLYTGVTSNLLKRIYEHKNKLTEGFTSKYDVDKLGYFEVFERITEAIVREKQLKGGSRKKKLVLIEQSNPEWRDLYDELL